MLSTLGQLGLPRNWVAVPRLLLVGVRRPFLPGARCRCSKPLLAVACRTGLAALSVTLTTRPLRTYLSGEFSTILKCEPRCSRHCRLVLSPALDSWDSSSCARAPTQEKCAVPGMAPLMTFWYISLSDICTEQTQQRSSTKT